MKTKMTKILTIALFLMSCGTQAEVSLKHINTNTEEMVKLLSQVNVRPSSCAELFLQGNVDSGIYTIYPKPWFTKNPIQVVCDMDTDGGGWTVFQKRDDFVTQENFTRDWFDYRRGFGKLEKDYWLGNDNLYVLTNQDYVTLRNDLEDFEGQKRFVVYKEFQVSNWIDKFRLKIGNYFDDAASVLQGLNNCTFVTYDEVDRDNCPVDGCKGGWWYETFFHVNFNGLYLRGNSTKRNDDGVMWNRFPYIGYFKMSEMKIRPTKFASCQGEV